MDGELLALRRAEHDDLEQVGRSIGSDHEPTIRVVTEIFDGDRMVDRVLHVFVGDAVSSR